MINLLSAFFSHPSDRLVALRRLVPTEVIDTSRTFTLLSGLLLLVTAWGLRRGKHRAFVAALFLSAVSVPMNLLKAFDFEEATAASALLFLLGIAADSFRVKSRAFFAGGFPVRGALVAIAFAAYAFLGCWVVEARYGFGASLGRAASEAVYQIFGLGQPSLVLRPGLTAAEHRVVTWFLDSLGLTGMVLLVGGAVFALRPVVHRGVFRTESARVAALLHDHGDSSVSAFALAPDSDYFFSANGRAVIAYRFQSNALLAIGDPIGPPEEIPPLLEGFERFCREHDWTWAFFQAMPERLPLYRARGWRAVHIGEDPVLIPGDFTLEGSAMGDVRRSARKIADAGWSARMFVPGTNPFSPRPDPDGLAHQLAQVSSEWLRGHAGGEKGFCMGRFEPGRLGDSWLAIAWHPGERRAAAFLTWTPIAARHGWALDLMRRRSDAPPGIMEFLVAQSVEHARERGDKVLSLSLSALARVDEPGGGPGSAAGDTADAEPAAARRARAFLMEHLARFYDFEGLFRWKSKFGPRFEDRYLVYPDSLSLPRVALALVRAQSPGGLRSYLRRSE
jgi:phosphatidylglycerol lysyltransferase